MCEDYFFYAPTPKYVSLDRSEGRVEDFRPSSVCYNKFLIMFYLT